MKKGFFMVLIFILALQIAGCGNSNSANGKKDSPKVNLAFSTWVGFAPLYIAEEKGYFKDNGVDVELTRMESSADRTTSLASDRVQGIASTVDSHVVTGANNIPITQVLTLDDSNGGDGIVAKKEIKSLEDLKGKTVGVQTDGGASFFWFLYLLKEEGINVDDINLENMNAGDAGAAFVAGKLDAAVTWEPWLTKAKDTDFGHLLASSDQTPGVIADTIAMKKNFVQENPDAVKGLVKAWYDALDYLESDKEDAVNIMAKAMGQTPEEFEEALKGVQYYDQAKNEEYFGTNDNPGDLHDLTEMGATVWKERGIIKNDPDVEGLLDYSFIK